MSKKIKENILIIGNLHSNPSANAFLIKFIKILKELGKNIYVVSGDEPPSYDNVIWIQVRYGENKKGTLLKNFYLFLKGQIIICWILLSKKIDYDKVIILPTSFIFATFILKIKRKKVAVFVAQELENTISKLLTNLNLKIADLLIVESKNVVKLWDIEKYREKIENGSLYIDTKLFNKGKEINKRENIVGYVGSLDERKGINHLINAIIIINDIMGNKVNFIICGAGKFEDFVKDFASKNDNVKFEGLVNYESLPNR